MTFTRYAIYAAPKGALGAVGAAWLGWDIHKGAQVPHPQIEGLNHAEITQRPRRYGFHATIKPPMHLADGETPDALIRAARSLCAGLAPVTLDGLKVARMGSFLALRPFGDVAALNAMACAVVRDLDVFRAPASDAELARRRNSRLSPRQEENLRCWGYPYVMDDYRFHITLTGPLENAEAALPLAADHFAKLINRKHVIDHLTLAGEDSDGYFHAVETFPFSSGSGG